MKGYLIMLAAAALIAAVPLSSASACGKVRGWAATYAGCGPSDLCRKNKLVVLQGCGGYFGKRSDRLLLPVLKDALARGLDKKLVQRVFDRYRCIPGARDMEGYKTVMRALNTAKCPTPAVLGRWFELRVSNANLRAAPSRSSRKVGWVLKGQVIERLRTAGAWYKVVSWAGVSKVTGYIHASLVVPY